MGGDMNCLIVSPYARVSGLNPDIVIPYGIAVISAVAKEIPGIRVTNLNLASVYSREAQTQRIVSTIERENIDIVLSGGNYTQRDCLCRVFEKAKTFKPEIVTIAGGIIVTGDPVPAMQYLQFADYGVVGEGEHTVVELITALAEGCSSDTIQNIAGLICKNGGGEERYTLTRPRPEIQNLGEIPLPDYEGFGIREIDPKISYMYCIGAGRGCPNRCTFCHNSQGKRYRERPLNLFFHELDYAYSHLRPPPGAISLYLLDDVIATHKERFGAICSGLKERNIMGWVCYARVRDIDEDIIRMLKSSGCNVVVLGVESANDAVLKSMRKNLTREQITNALEICGRNKLAVGANLIFGDPAETYDRALESIAYWNYWREHPHYPTYLRLFMIRVYPGSTLYRDAVSSGKIIDPVEYLRAGFPLVNVSGMTDREYVKIMSIVKNGDNNYLSRSNYIRKQKHSIYYDFESRDAIVTVKRCGCGNSYRKRIPFSGMSKFENCSCPECGRVIQLFDPESASGHEPTLKANIETMLSVHRKIAFWGIGRTFRNFMSAQLVADERIFLVDTRAEGSYADKKICSPNVLVREKLEAVVNSLYPLSKHYGELEKKIRDDYPGIKAIYNLYQLQSEEFPVINNDGFGNDETR
jgi:radical SAM superfamily enzyme YgiQ (UPF0313 family)